MSLVIHDPDEWETVTELRPCTACGGDLARCTGSCNGMLSVGSKRRDPLETARIRAGRSHAREDAVLAEARAILARRGVTASPNPMECRTADAAGP